jgi:hypothetical protein
MKQHIAALYMDSEWGLITRKTKEVTRGLGLSAIRPPNKGRSWDIEFNQLARDLINHACIMKPHKNSEHQGLGSSLIREHTNGPGGMNILTALGTLPNLATLHLYSIIQEGFFQRLNK